MQETNPPSCWTPPPAVLDLQPRRVDLWRARLDIPVEILNQLEMTLSPEERERAARFYFPADRDRFISAHGCLRDVLRRYLGCEPEQLAFSANQYGKPALHEHNLEFNLSHSGDFALLAVARDRRIGVDVERVRQDMEIEDIASHYFSKSEVSDLMQLPDEQEVMGFFNCWTRKEAYIKAQGLGLSLPLESFDVSLTPDEPALLRATRPDPQEAARWSLLSLEIDPCYRAAVVAEGIDLEFRLWDWNRTQVIQ